MNRLKFIFQNLRQRIKQTGLFSESIERARRRQMELEQLEAEQLERIRNLSKPRGKW